MALTLNIEDRSTTSQPIKLKNTIILYNPLPGFSNEDKGVPLSILSVAAPLESKNYTLMILDAKVEDREGACIRKALDGLDDAVCVGITCMTGPQVKGALDMARAIKQKAPKVPIVFGGWHPTLLPEETIRHELVDIVVKGQGDNSFAEIVEALREGKPLKEVKGIYYKENGKVIATECRPFEDINNSRPMPYHLIENIEKYIITDWYGNRMLSYMSSFGCPQSCTFCAENTMSGGRWKSLSPERVVKEIKNLSEKYNLDGIQFYDSNFFTHEERTRKICRGLIESGLKIKWGNANGSAKILLRYKPETWELMRAGGCSEILVGAESGDDEILEFLRKEVKADDYVRVKRLTTQYGIKLWVSLILGVPYDLSDPQKSLKREYKACTDLVRKLYKVEKDDRFALFVYTPYPGTPLYQHSLKNGAKVPQSLDGWSEFSLNTAHIPWMSKKHIHLTEFLMSFIFAHSKPPKQRGQQFSNRTPIKKLYLLLCHAIVYLRLQFNFFGLPYEHRVIQWVKRVLRRHGHPGDFVLGRQEMQEVPNSVSLQEQPSNA